MARKNTQAEELYEVAVLLLSALKVAFPKPGPIIGGLIRRAEKATEARPK